MKDRKAELPVLPHQDHGYAWVVCAGLFTYALVNNGSQKAFGIVYIGLLEKHRESETKSSLPSTVFAVASCVGSPVTGYLCERYEPRRIIMFGGLLCMSGCLVAAFAPSLDVVIVGYGLVCGLGSACFDSPLMWAMTQYWNKRKTMAFGIGILGASVGTFIFPTLYTKLNEEYTVQGTLTIIGGLYLNHCVIAMLIRNPPVYKNKANVITDKLADDGDISLEVESFSINQPFITKQNNMEKQCINDTLENEHQSMSEVETGNNKNTLKCRKSYKPIEMMFDQSNDNRNLLYNEGNTDELLSSPIREKEEYLDKEVLRESRSPNIEEYGKINAFQKQKSVPETNATLSDGTVHNNGFITLLRNPDFVQCLVCYFLILAPICTSFLLPPLAKQWGANDIQASYTITAMGVSELCTRVPLGFLIDRYSVDKMRLWSFCHLLCGVVGIVIAFTNNFYTLILYGALIGSCGSLPMLMLTGLLVETVPSDLLGRAAGILLFAVGLGISQGYLATGVIEDATGTYVTVLLLFCACFLATFVVGFAGAQCLRCYHKFKSSVTSTTGRLYATPAQSNAETNNAELHL